MPEIDIYIVLAQIINFGILLAVFHYFIGKKLTQNIEQRKIQLEKLRTAEEHYEQKMSLARQQKQELLDAARKTTAELMRESESIANQKAKNIIYNANKQALSILD
jgi:F0F1-type ATP synthase membrane subunit b/b'